MQTLEFSSSRRVGNVVAFMNITISQARRLKNLFVLADVCSDTDLINLKLVTYYESLREEFGLCNLLLMIQQHLKDEQKKSRVRGEDQAASPEASEGGTDEEAPQQIK